MRTRVGTIPVFCLFWGLVGARTTCATTVVAKLENQRIILAADTRGNALEKSSNPTTERAFHDDVCKIVALGKFGFAATGYSDYKRVELGDMVNDWSALEDARASYSSHADSLLEMADDWGRRAMQHYKTFYFVAPDRVKSLAGAGEANILVEGVFAGWDSKGQASLIFVIVALAQAALPPIIGTRYVLPRRDLPYTTNINTQKLVEGDSEHTRVIRKKWKKKSKTFPKSQRDWRWVEFLVESTSDDDKTVGKEADVLEVRQSGSTWLQNSGCPIR
jgi:hypothetical protein